MMIPIKLDRKQERFPVVNVSLILCNIAIFLLFTMTPLAAFERIFVLNPMDPKWFQFITAVFLHGGPMHIIGNMVFLYIFGNAVEDRLGHFAYLAFYLAAGIAASFGHILVSDAPVIGASGALNAVMGAFLIFFPFTKCLIIIFLFLIFPVYWSSMVLILLMLAFDIFYQVLEFGGMQSSTAYMAHIGGAFFGMSIGALILLLRIVDREPYDVVSILERRKRRREMRAVTRQHGSMWTGDITAKGGRAPKLSKDEEALYELRSKIINALAADRGDEALPMYRELIAKDTAQVLARTSQLDLANYAMQEQDYAIALDAYEKFLKHYTFDSKSNEVRLLAGIIYANYLPNKERARELFNTVLTESDYEDHLATAKQMLAKMDEEAS